MVTSQEVNWMIGGPQGSGVDSAANIFGRACGYGGLHIYGSREYHSNIKGAHSYFHVRISDKEVFANVNDVNLLAAFDAETVVRHVDDVVQNGGVILNKEDLGSPISSIKTLPLEFKEELMKSLEERGFGRGIETTIAELMEVMGRENVHVFPIPYMEMLEELGKELGIDKISRITRTINVLTLGISFALLDYDAAMVEKAIKATFGAKPSIINMNVSALRKAYNYVRRTFGNNFFYKLKKADVAEKRIFLQGNQAVALGKILGGCRIQSYYPITPAADESEYLEMNEILSAKNGEEGGIVVMQTEDEIAAVNLASGATLAGARAATSTSGPGFSLMVEGLSWAGNSEVPLVITHYQRGAPSTGLPTRHGQDDLRFVINAGHGSFPRIVLASGDVKECVYDTVRAFNYAEKFQMPVIHLLDKALANSTKSHALFDLSGVKIERGELLTEKDVGGMQYKRFKFTESGISPRAVLGTKGAVHWYTGDEHNEFGNISEDSINRTKMMDKRMRKLDAAAKQIPLEEKANYFGNRDAETVVVSWGSTKGAIFESVEALNNEGFSIGFLQIRLIHPLPKEYVAKVLGKAKTKVAVEMNYSGQLAEVIKEETAISTDYFVLKYNGRPMTMTEVYEALKQILLGKASSRQVLTYGA
jgi:2-oxoglutarate ferredoxin oxidoreductase subunit alpha